MCVLLVEDDHALRVVMAHLLRQAGYDVVETDNGLEALDRLASHKIDVVLTDVEMPGMDGLRLLGEVRRQFPAVAVIVISGHFSYASAAQQLGAACYLSKPCSRWQLVNAVQTTLRQAVTAVS